MRITIDKNISTPVYVQIKNEIKVLIHEGVLPAGFILPPERKLASAIGVSRSTVIKAYDELKALGLVESHVGKGTVVSAKVERKSFNEEQQVLPFSWYPLFDKQLESANDTVSELINAGTGQDIISFAAGIADPNLYPLKQLKAIQKEYPLNSEMHNLCSIEGYYPLRESLSQLMELRSLSVSPKEVMILSGSMQGIDYAARTFLSPGDVVIVEEPTFLQAIQSFKTTGAKIIGVPLDHDGIRTDILEALLERYKPKFIYTMPTFHNPTGITMSIKRRMELLQLAYKFRVPILEDDPYNELAFSEMSLPPLKELDNYGYVIYLSTFSKVLFSGMRIGWVIAPEPVIKKFALLKQMTDLHVNTPSQYQLDHFLRKDYYETHLKHVLSAYKIKRDLMASALNQKEELIHFDLPAGGYYLWCRVPKHISQKKLLSRCASKGVMYTPGNVFFPQESDGEQYIRLNYTYETCDRIEKGISILLDAIKELNDQKQIQLKKEFRPIV